MSEKKQVKSKNFINAATLIVVIGLLAYYVANNAQKSMAIVLSLAGLGVVIFIHELGHFLAGKFSGIKVEAFAIGFGPVFLGIKKCANGFRVRILPTLFLKNGDEAGDELLCFTIGGKFKEGETEYQIRLIPLGGFVKFLGQEDTGADKPSDDPRSFVNVPIWKRVCVGSAGVIFNVILAIVLFVIVYTAGINFPPAVVGSVTEGFPAAEAGLQAGDEIIEINGKSDKLDFTNIMAAGAFSDKDQLIPMKVKRRDGSIEDFSVPVKESPRFGAWIFGISPATTLEIAKLSDDTFFKETGLKTGDRLIAINDEPIEHFWQYNEITKEIFSPTFALAFERKDSPEPVICNVEMQYQTAYQYTDANDFVPANVFGLVPRLKIIGVAADINDKLAANDIIIEVAGTLLPNYKQFRELTEANVGKDMSMAVLRDGEVVGVSVMPKLDEDNRSVVGVFVMVDVEHTVIASTAGNNDLQIPAGAEIESIDGKKVANFFDIADTLKNLKGKTVKVAYLNEGKSVIVDFTVSPETSIKMKGLTTYDIPFKMLKRLYKASGPVEAAKMGWDKTVSFIMQSYMMIKGLIVGRISPKGLMGPIGIITTSSTIIAEKEFLQYINFMAIISACLAVMNFLPLPILDGGLVVLLIIEKIKGSPVNIKIQEVITYIGIALIGTLFIVITFNDIVRVFFK
ncbi:MAG: site-2 protease family protein [Anaerohalosphaeraceae bacterium]|nr:site-2 protease family protein [Anaerohalosphaeraceae bacterium]